MARPHDIWEFGWSGGYDKRYAFIQSLPEDEQEWATLTFHYIDLAFMWYVESAVKHTNWGNLSLDERSAKIDEIREYARMKLEPPTDDRWKFRFKLEESYKFFEREEDE